MNKFPLASVHLGTGDAQNISAPIGQLNFGSVPINDEGFENISLSDDEEVIVAPKKSGFLEKLKNTVFPKKTVDPDAPRPGPVSLQDELEKIRLVDPEKYQLCAFAIGGTYEPPVPPQKIEKPTPKKWLKQVLPQTKIEKRLDRKRRRVKRDKAAMRKFLVNSQITSYWRKDAVIFLLEDLMQIPVQAIFQVLKNKDISKDYVEITICGQLDDAVVQYVQVYAQELFELFAPSDVVKTAHAVVLTFATVNAVHKIGFWLAARAPALPMICGVPKKRGPPVAPKPKRHKKTPPPVAPKPDKRKGAVKRMVNAINKREHLTKPKENADSKVPKVVITTIERLKDRYIVKPAGLVIPVAILATAEIFMEVPKKSDKISRKDNITSQNVKKVDNKVDKIDAEKHVARVYAEVGGKIDTKPVYISHYAKKVRPVDYVVSFLDSATESDINRKFVSTLKMEVNSDKIVSKDEVKIKPADAPKKHVTNVAVDVEAQMEPQTTYVEQCDIKPTPLVVPDLNEVFNNGDKSEVEEKKYITTCNIQLEVIPDKVVSKVELIGDGDKCNATAIEKPVEKPIDACDKEVKSNEIIGNATPLECDNGSTLPRAEKRVKRSRKVVRRKKVVKIDKPEKVNEVEEEIKPHKTKKNFFKIIMKKFICGMVEED